MKYSWQRLVLGFMIGTAQIALAQGNRIKFNDQDLFLSGANLAWIDFAGDIGPGPTDFKSFGEIMLAMHDHGGNALRWWLHTNGTVTPAFDNSGLVIGPGVGAIADLRRVLDLAWEREVGLKLCLWSFDMLHQQNNATVLGRNLLLLTDTTYTRTYINNALIPMVDSLRGHPAIIAWEIFNEPEGMSTEFGWVNQRVPMANIQRFINLCTGAIHRTDPEALVTSGAWSFRSLTDVPTSPLSQLAADISRASRAEQQQLEQHFARKYRVALAAEEIILLMQRWESQAGFNYYSDNRLISAGGDREGTLDFYSVHYYPSNFPTSLSPFHHPQGHWNLDKQIVAAEFPMQDIFGVLKQDLFETLYRNGYAGALPWSWTDENFSSHADMLAGMQHMWDNHREDVDVDGIGGDWPLVTITSPVSGTEFPNGAEITIAATASDPDGMVVAVEFFASDTLKIGTATTAPYEVTWRNITPNVYALTAVATDDRGHQRTSNRVSIKVGTPQMVRLEAERAARTGTPAVFGDPTASNGACLRMQQTGTITWQLPAVPEAGSYEVSFGYRLPYDTPKHQFINVNGTRVAEITFDGALNVWREKNLVVNLVNGANTIQMELSWGWMDIDYLAVPSNIVTAVETPFATIVGFSLQQNYPNPFNPLTTISYALARPERVRLAFYDAQGRQLGVLLDEKQDAGVHLLTFDGSNLASGVYFYRLTAGSFADEKRMLLVK